MIEEDGEEDDFLSFLDKLLEIEDEDEGTEHLVEELLANSGDLADEALVEKLLENFDLEEEEVVVSFFDSFHFSSMNIVCSFCREIWTRIQMNWSNFVCVSCVLFDYEFVVIQLKKRVTQSQRKREERSRETDSVTLLIYKMLLFILVIYKWR